VRVCCAPQCIHQECHINRQRKERFTSTSCLVAAAATELLPPLQSLIQAFLTLGVFNSSKDLPGLQVGGLMLGWGNGGGGLLVTLGRKAVVYLCRGWQIMHPTTTSHCTSCAGQMSGPRHHMPCTV
jgi:hypothetical protein